MVPEPPPSTDGVSRRALLASATGLTVATSGCLRQVRSVVGRETLDQLSVTVSTVVDDYDRGAVQIAGQLAANLETVGVDVTLEFLEPVELSRRVLINTDFDVYVGRHPADHDPDFLYDALHGNYAYEAGWQNPFGFTSMSLDDHLETQRELEGEARRAEIETILEFVATEQPFTPLCVPDDFRVVRTDRFDGWDRSHPATRLGSLGLDPLTDADELRAVITDTRPTKNLNPLSAEYHDQSTVVSLLYDSLLVRDGDDAIPWLAETIDREESTLEITLREDLRWHDDEPLTADDVEFTYRFLEDTSLGENGVASPAPQYRTLATAFDHVDAEDDRTLTIETSCGPAVTARALTVPILPKHVWADRTDEASFSGVASAMGTTDAVVTDNVPPVGSGPFAFADRTERDVIVLERFPDHFTRRPDVSLPEPTVETLRVPVEPRSAGAIERVEDGDADAMLSTLEATTIDEVPESDDLEILESPSWAFYHLGFNVRDAPFSNPYVRQTVARLLDKSWIASEVFDGYARPTATPVTDEWTPESLRWDGQDPDVPFLGTNGELDVDDARDAFKEIGFTYDEEWRLLTRG